MALQFFNRKGEPIEDMMEWARLLADPAYRVVAHDVLDNGTQVWTHWVGFDMGLGWYLGGPPLLFETLAFAAGVLPAMESMGGLALFAPNIGQERYATEAAAIAGHDQIVAKLTAEAQAG